LTGKGKFNSQADHKSLSECPHPRLRTFLLALCPRHSCFSDENKTELIKNYRQDFDHVSSFSCPVERAVCVNIVFGLIQCLSQVKESKLLSLQDALLVIVLR